MIKEIDLLIALQKVDTTRHQLVEKQVALPREIATLQTDIAEDNAAYQALKRDIDYANGEAVTYNEEVKERQEVLKEKKAQLKSTRKNSDYDLLSKEIALKDVECKLAQKKAKEAKALAETHAPALQALREKIKDKETLLASKQEGLTTVEAFHQEEEQTLDKQREELLTQLGADFVTYYEKQAKHFAPDPAVTGVGEGACANCHITVPLQDILDIQDKKRLINCENCGAILAYVIKEEQEEVNPKLRRRPTRRRKPLFS